jgi:hypothetical protein
MNAARLRSSLTSFAALVVSALLAASCSNADVAPAGDVAATPPVAAAAEAQPVSAPAPAIAAAPEPSSTIVDASAATAVAANALAGAPATAVATAAAVPTTPPSAADLDAAKKKAQIDWALEQDEIKRDPKGQWATKASASSTINDAKGKVSYSADQATGVPDVQSYGASPQAWSAKMPDAGIEWIELTFARSVHATMIRIRESYGSGAVIRVEALDEKGVAHVVWTGTDTTKELNYLAAEFPKTAFKTNRVKLTLATNVVGGANQIDAVQLLGTDQ